MAASQRMSGVKECCFKGPENESEAIRKNIDKTNPEIINWCTDVMIDIYKAIEG
jgi:hypothetical protein